MPRQFRSIAISALTVLALFKPALADEEMDRIIETAAPHMNHSCESVLSEYGEDDAKVIDIVRLMAMVSLYNRQIDVLTMVPEEEDRAGLRDEFVEELEDACDDDPGRLLAGAVDDAVKATFEAFE